MSIKTVISDSSNGNTAKVLDDGSLIFTLSQQSVVTPEIGTVNKVQYFTGLLSTAAGVTAMDVNGSVTPVEYYLKSNEEYDINIMQILILFSDSSVSHNLFGNITALTNGFDLKITEDGFDTYLVQNAKTGGQLIAQSGLGRPFGTGSTTFTLVNWTGTADAVVVNIPIGEWVPGGLRIGRGNTDKLTAIVKDDITGLNEMFVRVFGYKTYP